MTKMNSQDFARLRRVYCDARNGTEDTIRALLDHIEQTHPPVMDVAGVPVSREDVIEGLRITYRDSVCLAQQDEPSLTGFPDLERMLDHIEQHGLEPKPWNL